MGYFKGIHPVVFRFSVNYVSIYANRKSLWCFGNFSNSEKLPGEFHPVVFGFMSLEYQFTLTVNDCVVVIFPIPKNYQVRV